MSAQGQCDDKKWGRAIDLLGKRSSVLWLFFAASILLLSMLAFFWVGFLGSDDVLYWRGSSGWLRHFPYLGGDHWTLRHTLVIPIALARLILGNSAASLALPTILYAEGTIAIIGVLLWRDSGPLTAIIALVLISTYPQMIIYSSTADIDVGELFFVLLAFFLLSSVFARLNGRKPSPSDQRALFFAGTSLGLALLSRETAVFSVVAVAVLCFVQYKLERKYYLLVFLGVIAVVGLEIIYLWSLSGHFLYRYSLDAHHDSNINRWIDQGAAIPFVHPAIDPIIMLLLNHNFGLVSWIAIPLSIWLSLRRDLSGGERTLVVLMGTLALVWSVLAAGLWTSLVLIPRYYLIPAICVLILAAIALNRMWQDGRRWLPSLLIALLVASSTVALALDNRNFMIGEHKLVELAASRNIMIHTDPQTLRRADLLLEWANVRGRVTDRPFHSGDFVFVNPLRNPSKLNPGIGWKLLYETPIPFSGGHLIACSLPDQLVPKAMRGTVGCHHDSLKLFQVGAT